jgi:hypothetical protein
VPARVVRDVGAQDDRWTVHAAEHYTDLARWYRENLDQTGSEGAKRQPPRP